MKLLLTVVVGGYSATGQLTGTKVFSEPVFLPEGVLLERFVENHAHGVRRQSEFLSDAPVKMILSVAHCVIP